MRRFYISDMANRTTGFLWKISEGGVVTEAGADAQKAGTVGCVLQGKSNTLREDGHYRMVLDGLGSKERHETDYRIFVGGATLEEIGERWGTSITLQQTCDQKYFGDCRFFESMCGRMPIRVEHRERYSAGAEWKTLFTTHVDVDPCKVGGVASVRQMVADLERLNPGSTTDVSASTEGVSRESLKPTWLLFENWCVWRVVDALRNAGVALVPHDSGAETGRRGAPAYKSSRAGTVLFGAVDGAVRLRVRHEPLIFRPGLGEGAPDGLFRADASDRPLCPDLVVERLKLGEAGWTVERCVVADIKHFDAQSGPGASYLEKFHDLDRKYSKIVGPKGLPVLAQLWMFGCGQRGIVEGPRAGVFRDNWNTGEGWVMPQRDFARKALWVQPTCGTKEDRAELAVFREFAENTCSVLLQ